MSTKNCSCTEFRKILRSKTDPYRLIVKFHAHESPAIPGRVYKVLVEVELNFVQPTPAKDKITSASITTERKLDLDQKFNWLHFESLSAACIVAEIQTNLDNSGYNETINSLSDDIHLVIDHAIDEAVNSYQHTDPDQPGIYCVPFQNLIHAPSPAKSK